MISSWPAGEARGANACKCGGTACGRDVCPMWWLWWMLCGKLSRIVSSAFRCRRGERAVTIDSGRCSSPSVEGATYVKPYNSVNTEKTQRVSGCCGLCVFGVGLAGKGEERTWKIWFALSLSVEKTGESTGIWRVNLVSNCETSSWPCCFVNWIIIKCMWKNKEGLFFLPAWAWLVAPIDVPAHPPNWRAWRKCVSWWPPHLRDRFPIAGQPVASWDDAADLGHRESDRPATWSCRAEWFRSSFCGSQRWMVAVPKKKLLVNIFI